MRLRIFVLALSLVTPQAIASDVMTLVGEAELKEIFSKNFIASGNSINNFPFFFTRRPDGKFLLSWDEDGYRGNWEGESRIKDGALCVPDFDNPTGYEPENMERCIELYRSGNSFKYRRQGNKTFRGYFSQLIPFEPKN